MSGRRLEQAIRSCDPDRAARTLARGGQSSSSVCSCHFHRRLGTHSIRLAEAGGEGGDHRWRGAAACSSLGESRTGRRGIAFLLEEDLMGFLEGLEGFLKSEFAHVEADAV